MSIENTLDRIHIKARRNRFLQYFAAFNRIILAIAFIPSGTTKLLGNRFTILSLDNPVGFFFEAFYQTGGWYRFVGFCQVMAAALLLIPRTATLGAVIFFPIILNIAIITISAGFQGTWVITSLMLLANLYLICWDYDKFKAILPFSRGIGRHFSLKRSLPAIVIWGIGGVLAFGFFAMANQSFSKLGVLGAASFFLAGCVFGLFNSWQRQYMEI